MNMLCATTIDRDVARDFAGTIRAARALAAKGRAQAESVRQLIRATRLFARVHRSRTDGCAEIDRIHNLTRRAIALGIAPASVHAWSATRYSRVRLETFAHV